MDTAHMFDRRRVNRALGEIGFVPVGPLQYELRELEPAIHKYVSLRLLGIYRWEVDGYVGLVHRDAEAFAEKCLHDFGGSWWRWALTKKSELPFKALARLGKVAGWNPPRHTLEIKNLSADESAERLRQDIERLAVPYLRRIGSAREFFELLISNEEPMPWYQWGPLHRLCQVVFLAQREGVSSASYLPIFEAERKFITNQLNGPDPDWFLAKVQEAATLAANSTAESDARKSGARGSL